MKAKLSEKIIQAVIFFNNSTAQDCVNKADHDLMSN